MTNAPYKHSHKHIYNVDTIRKMIIIQKKARIIDQEKSQLIK